MSEKNVKDVLKELSFDISNIQTHLSHEDYVDIRCEFLDVTLRMVLNELFALNPDLFKRFVEKFSPSHITITEYEGNDQNAFARKELLRLLILQFKAKVANDHIK